MCSLVTYARRGWGGGGAWRTVWFSIRYTDHVCVRRTVHDAAAGLSDISMQFPNEFPPPPPPPPFHLKPTRAQCVNDTRFPRRDVPRPPSLDITADVCLPDATTRGVDFVVVSVRDTVVVTSLANLLEYAHTFRSCRTLTLCCRTTEKCFCWTQKKKTVVWTVQMSSYGTCSRDINQKTSEKQ